MRLSDCPLQLRPFYVHEGSLCRYTVGGGTLSGKGGLSRMLVREKHALSSGLGCTPLVIYCRLPLQI
jgi:hypothetical protein